MAIENLPLFSAVNDEEVKQPAHPHHGHPSHPFDCAPHGRPFTNQEAHYEILHRVEACVAEVHRFEERVRYELDKFMRASNTENQAFKEALQASHNCFLETVQNEVNNFEQSIRNDYDLFRSDIDQRFADFETSINNAYTSLADEYARAFSLLETQLHATIDNSVSNMTTTHEALMEDLRAMRTSLNEDYSTFVNTVNNAYKAMQTAVNNRLASQDDKIGAFGQHMVNNLPLEVRKAIAEKITNGELTTLMQEWFGTEHRFRGAATYDNRYSITEPQQGDYFFCTDNEHFYMYGQVSSDDFEAGVYTWFDVGTGILAINQMQTAVDNLHFTRALHFENLRMELDTVNKTVKLIRPYDHHTIIFTVSRWVTVDSDKTFSYADAQGATTNGFTCAFVYNSNSEAIHMRVMNDSAVSNIFDSHDIVLFGVWFDSDMNVENVVYADVNNFFIDGYEYKRTVEPHEIVGCYGDIKFNIDTVNSKLIWTGYGHVFGHYLEGQTFSRNIVAHETAVEFAGRSTSYAIVIDRACTLQLRMQAHTKHNPFVDGDLIVGYAFITYADGVYKLDNFACHNQLERLVYFNGAPAFKADATASTNLHKIFRRVCCCGDSYTSANITKPDGTVVETNEEFAFPHFLTTSTGNEWINCGQSGANVLTWQTAERGLAKARSEGKVQAYVIGLMLNDSQSGTNRYVSVGVPTDIGTDAQTFYGGMSSIIRSLNAISPEAKIFVLTTPRTDAAIAPYNQAVVDIVAAYKKVYPIHCLDLRNYMHLYNTSVLENDRLNGHYTAVGYEIFAENLAFIMSEYIANNVASFQNVPFIEYDTVNVTYNNGNLSVDV